MSRDPKRSRHFYALRQRQKLVRQAQSALVSLPEEDDNMARNYLNNSEVLAWASDLSRTDAELKAAYLGLGLPTPAPKTKDELRHDIVAYINGMSPAEKRRKSQFQPAPVPAPAPVTPATKSVVKKPATGGQKGKIVKKTTTTTRSDPSAQVTVVENRMPWWGWLLLAVLALLLLWAWFVAPRIFPVTQALPPVQTVIVTVPVEVEADPAEVAKEIVKNLPTPEPAATEAPAEDPKPEEKPAATEAPAAPIDDSTPLGEEFKIEGMPASVERGRIDIAKGEFKNTFGMGTEAWLAKPGKLLVGPDFPQEKIDSSGGAIERFNPLNQDGCRHEGPCTLMVPGGGFAFASLGGGRIATKGVFGDAVLNLPFEEGLNYHIYIRGLYGDNKPDTDENTDAILTGYVPGHVEVSYYPGVPNGGFIDETQAMVQRVNTSHTGSTNCGDKGCSKLVMVFLDLNTGAMLVIRQDAPGAAWYVVQTNF